MANSQNTAYVNCPACGEVIELVCPETVSEVNRVLAFAEACDEWDDDPSIHNRTVCVKCTADLYVYWWV
jgi:hypothetical protein